MIGQPVPENPNPSPSAVLTAGIRFRLSARRFQMSTLNLGGIITLRVRNLITLRIPGTRQTSFGLQVRNP
jgi:hypothetical protein